jgi:hypothetical protein
MWGRRNTARNSVATMERAAHPRELNAVSQLLRRADWETLDDGARATLVSAYPPLDAIGSNPARGYAATADEEPLQEWIARVVAPRFQPEIATGVRSWLETAAPGGHLYVGGDPGLGRTSLVASVCRQVMKTSPVPTSFCYVPDPSALDTPLLLALPQADAKALAKALYDEMSALAGHWQEAGQHGGASTLTQLVARHLDRLQAAAPEATKPYVVQLRGALDALAQAKGALPFDADHLPLGHVSPDPEAVDGAPAVVAARAPIDVGDALLRANGGVLIANAAAIDFGDLVTPLTKGALVLNDGWPAVPLNVRVVLIGTGDIYDNLSGGDFSRLFRYELWANPVVDWTRETEAAYAALADGVTRRYSLPALDASAVSRLIEESARRVGGMNRSRLGTDLSLPHDLAAEAGRLAQSSSATTTSGAHVDTVLRQRRALQAANARWMRQAILSGAEITPTAGATVGQINGLGILEFHPWESIFAVPMRISASVSPGRDEKLVDIEHAVSATDADHVRGEMTAEGFLATRYGQELPLSFLARIRFEQEHGATGGDSASAAVLYALLSALAQMPVRRSLAVTGALGQYGELQPIGGVNFKIEGFWELCRLRRAQGEQAEDGYGVIIPAVNTRDLMLRPEVAQAIADEGWFRIYPISTFDEGIPLLIGIPAETLHQRVAQRLQRFREIEAGERGRR